VDDLYNLNPKFTTTTTDPLNGLGYKADKIKILWQKTDKGVKPKPELWNVFDLNLVYGQTTDPVPVDLLVKNAQNIIDPTLLVQHPLKITSTDLVIPTKSTPFVLNEYIKTPLKTQPDYLQFNDETVLMGNITAEKESRLYETFLVCNLKDFNISQNPTWDKSSDVLYISERGIYDSDDNMVFIAKLAKPLKKGINENKVVYLKYDF
jgi:hypothetical protein